MRIQRIEESKLFTIVFLLSIFIHFFIFSYQKKLDLFVNTSSLQPILQTMVSFSDSSTKHHEQLNSNREGIDPFSKKSKSAQKKAPVVNKKVAKKVESKLQAMQEIRIKFEKDVHTYLSRINLLQYYPRVAQREGMEGAVELLLQFNENNKLISIKVAKEGKHAILDRSALRLANDHWMRLQQMATQYSKKITTSYQATAKINFSLL